MNFLVCNDDGYNKIGIEILKQELSFYGHVYVCAPSSEKSASSTSVTIGRLPNIVKIEEDVLSCDGTPADSCLYGLINYGINNIDIVFSGINNGYNLAQDTLYSGTIGVGVLANIYSKKAIALSCLDKDEDTIRKKTKFILKFIFDNKLYEKFNFLSVNYPHPSKEYYEVVKPTKIYKLYMDYERDLTEIKKDPVDSDRYNVMNGYFSISALNSTYNSDELYNKLKNEI